MIKNRSRLVRGTAGGMLLSAAIHAILLLLAGGIVVFTVKHRTAAQFVPAKVDRPKMKLQKLRVTVKDVSQPRRTVERITSTAAMSKSDIQLPEVTGMGSALDAKIGGFKMMADLSSMNMIGSPVSVGNDLVGTFYDLKRYADGSEVKALVTDGNANEYFDVVDEFFKKDWDPAVFDRYWKAPSRLYATQLFVPEVRSWLGPSRFGMGFEIKARDWVVYYKGKIAHPQGGKFRFVGTGDDLFVVRLNRKIVLDASWSELPRHKVRVGYWTSPSPDDKKWSLGNMKARVGEWFELQPNEPVEMEAMASETPGGLFYMMLLVQEFGVEYPENDQGAPILPIFKMTETPAHVKAEINYFLIPGQADLDNGPVFSVR